MRVRRLLVVTALVASILGAIAAYLAMTVPNDLKAGSLLKQARAHISAGRTGDARDALSQVIQQFPRTDAAAAATVALVRLEEQERQKLQNEVATLKADSARQTKALVDLRTSVENARAAAAKTPAVTAPAPAKKTTVRKAPAKKAPVRRPTKRRK